MENNNVNVNLEFDPQAECFADPDKYPNSFGQLRYIDPCDI